MSSYQPRKLDLTVHQIKKLGDAIMKDTGTVITIKPTQNNKGDSLYLTARQIKKLDKAMKDNKNVRLAISKPQLAAQPEGGGLFDVLARIVPKVLPFLKNLVAPLGLAGATGAISGLAYKKAQGKKKGDGIIRAGEGVLQLTPSNIKMIMDTVKNLEEHNVIPKGLNEAIMHQIKIQDGGFIGTLLAALAGPLLSSLLGGKGLTKAGSGLKIAGSGYLN